MISKYRCCVCDMDGTLLNSNGRISYNDERMLKKLQEYGINVVIASGRPDFFLKPYVRQLKLNNYIISYNGALIKNIKDGKVVYSKIMNKKICREVIEYCIKNDVDFIICTYKMLYSSEKNLRGIMYYNLNNILDEDMKIPIKFVNRNIINYIDNMDILKILIVSSPKQIILMKKRFSTVNEVALISSLTGFLDIMNFNISKGNAVKILSKEFNIDLKEFIAFGDNYNDLDMLKCVGLPIAMGNSIDAIKNVAKYVTKSNEDSGIAYAINKLFFDNL
ncbi:Cof-type HAD-IIB family hydrolase [Clostridium sp. cel8]|jgi:Cof subfamily protein (haloacid dehalogenase superfamily)|uniref:Cof-type HAD-IIB family hydrolase n=1 Tax=Clostridium sp. cel8 TaxID=2663123 RepID=UPI001A9AB369|nr:Cof-type HAD-IIB family hydrolase [Clostridium sp. cel8]